MNSLILKVTFLFFAAGCWQTCATEELQLVLVQVVYRHGDRTPIDIPPKDPYWNESFWPEGFGELTKLGVEQHYDLGQWLGNRYREELFGSIYNSGDIYIRCTDVNRTIQSAASNYQGFQSVFKTSIPIDFEVVPQEADEVLYYKIGCPSYDEEFGRIVQEDVSAENGKLKDLYSFMSQNSGWSITSVVGAFNIQDVATIEKAHNLTLPYWVEGIYPDPLMDISGHAMDYPVSTIKSRRLASAGGPLLKHILDQIHKKISNNLNFKMIQYSAHDVTVANFLGTLGLKDENLVPQYAATVITELRVNTQNQYFISVLFKNSTEVRHPYVLQIPGCDSPCPLEKFIELMKPVTPITWAEECQQDLHPGSFRINQYEYWEIY